MTFRNDKRAAQARIAGLEADNEVLRAQLARPWWHGVRVTGAIGLGIASHAILLASLPWQGIASLSPAALWQSSPMIFRLALAAPIIAAIILGTLRALWPKSARNLLTTDQPQQVVVLREGRDGGLDLFEHMQHHDHHFDHFDHDHFD